MSETQEKINESKADVTDGFVNFLIRTCMIGAVITACTLFTVDWIIGSVEESFARSIKSLQQTWVESLQQTSIGGRKFWARLEEELDNAASPASDLPPERKQKLINNVRIIAARWRPLIDALQDDRQTPPQRPQKPANSLRRSMLPRQRDRLPRVRHRIVASVDVTHSVEGKGFDSVEFLIPSR